MPSSGILPLQGAFLAALQQFAVLTRHIQAYPSCWEDLGIGAAEVLKVAFMDLEFLMCDFPVLRASLLVLWERPDCRVVSPVDRSGGQVRIQKEGPLCSCVEAGFHLM
ncbi:uncharacterized protein LOC124657710 isoform X2 [Lolium rigidum]|uniref:uncharacterized protein LOC124651578 isoform X2 n=1 Tax=Lolium rigidum TaxID=89674 RepID=UPI001F5D4BCD|nr:uncharacterized protein LOC124651578 isoform X2 [Lolium rigidum]XP_047052180.1 uncharacterized protein LOC124657710 isoform X2 [Lolium rigidum]